MTQINRSHRFNIGDVLQGSWGYEQTNQEFVVVTNVIGKATVEVQRIGKTEAASHGLHAMSRDVTPDPAKRIGEPVRCRVTRDGRFALYRPRPFYEPVYMEQAENRSYYESWYA